VSEENRAPHGQGDGRTLDIKERDCLTRFSYAWGPLCRWPWLTPDEVKIAVERELEGMASRVI
jgi:hypothetical protein